jgi:hypothetical protein
VALNLDAGDTARIARLGCVVVGRDATSIPPSSALSSHTLSTASLDARLSDTP